MKYISTRGSSEVSAISSAQAIVDGLAPDGGLYVPESIPQIKPEQIEAMGEMSYAERAVLVFNEFLTDFTQAELVYCTESAYNVVNFDTDSITSIAELFDGTYILELWHGPTCAFKDMALQILPFLLTTSMKKTEGRENVVILVATSGDTGKAALEGFSNVPGTEIIVFYPVDGVSQMQKRQMITQEGVNVGVCAVDGNFDDCQTAVKEIFTDPVISKKLEKSGKTFSSANSINWGRLVPQIVYYISAYATLVKNGKIKTSEKVNICVPTGNFGNILAAFYAKQMGLPVNKLVCASNTNNILTDFINTGIYDRNREFYTTLSPSMDILISSNLERLLYHLSDAEHVRQWFKSLSETGRYEVTPEVKALIAETFVAGCCNDEETKAEIRRVFEKYSYTLDTHTAVASKVYSDYAEKTGDKTPVIIASTASPYKFGGSVIEALTGKPFEGDEFGSAAELRTLTHTEIPKTLADLAGKPIRFKDVSPKDKISDYVTKTLSI